MKLGKEKMILYALLLASGMICFTITTCFFFTMHYMDLRLVLIYLQFMIVIFLVIMGVSIYKLIKHMKED